MNPSQACTNLVKQFEGLRLEAYRDSGGVPTIGWGHTAHVSMGPPPDLIDETQAEAFLAGDLAAAGALVAKYVTVPLAQCQFDALTCFAFNMGRQGFEDAQGAPTTMLRFLNEGDYQNAANSLLSWKFGRVNGQLVILPGLVRRRAAERALFLGVVTA